jgi:putative nucleotidyltransferase with HDIG domain
VTAVPTEMRQVAGSDGRCVAQCRWDVLGDVSCQDVPRGFAASVNVRRFPPSVGFMNLADWAEETACTILQTPLPRRWAHTLGVAAQASSLAPILGSDADLLTAAALLHDIGYAPELVDTGFHPLDGARYLSDTTRATDMLCRLVAHHSCALIEAGERGLAAQLSLEFEPARSDLTDALIYCDMTAGPDGQHMQVEQRLADIRARYGPDDPVSRALTRSAPLLTGAVTRIARQLARCIPPPAARPAPRVRVLAAAT